MASIQKVVNKKGVIAWRVQIELRGRREYKTFPVKNLAVAWANQREAEIVQGKVLSSSVAEQTPFSTVIATYREKELPKLRNRSYKFMLNTLEKRFGRHRLLDLQKKDFARFRDDRLEEGYAPATVVKELNLARRLIDYAIKDLDIYLPSNTARLVDNPKVNNARTRVFINAEEKRRFFDAFPSDDYRAIAGLAIETACRLGELLKMEWHHVDFDRRLAVIPKAHTKTEVARTIPLSFKAIEILQSRPGPRRKGRVFACWKAGDSFENGYRRAVTRARETYEADCKARRRTAHPDLLKDLRFHDLRHIATSQLAKTFNVIELSMITGHSDVKMLKRYYHITPEALAAKLR